MGLSQNGNDAITDIYWEGRHAQVTQKVTRMITTSKRKEGNTESKTNDKKRKHKKKPRYEGKF